MSKERTKAPPSAFERCAAQFEEAAETFDKIVRDKTVIDNLDRFDVSRGLVLASDHIRIARLLLIDSLKKAASVAEDPI